MGCEQQYINLYHDAGELLCRNSCDVMNERRGKAFDDFCRLGFPSRKNERYKYTDVGAAFAPDFGLNLNRLPLEVDPYRAYRCSVPNIGTALYYMVNEQFHAATKPECTLPKDVYVGAICAYDKVHPGMLQDFYGKIADTRHDAVTALNTALAQDGLLIYIPSGVKVDQTLQIVNLMHGNVDLMTNRRTLIILGDEAEAGLLFCEHVMDKARFLTTNVAEVFIGKRACLNIYGVEETAANSTLFDNLYLSQAEGSSLEYVSLSLRNGITRRTAEFAFDGGNSKARIMGAVVANGNQRVDNHLIIGHKRERCKSEVLYKYVLDGNATGAFAGKVLVSPGAQQTDSQETNANLCVSPAARMYTQPMLEIYADDVKCNHGSTVGQIDQTALFYMAQRGISPEEARLLLQHAFVNEVIAQIRLEPLRERLSAMVEQRFRHSLKACTDCGLCK